MMAGRPKPPHGGLRVSPRTGWQKKGERKMATISDKKYNVGEEGTEMKIAEIINTLPIKTGTDKFNERINRAIQDTANVIAPILAARNLRIVRGGTNPTSQRSYARIYLEPVTNTS